MSEVLSASSCRETIPDSRPFSFILTFGSPEKGKRAIRLDRLLAPPENSTMNAISSDALADVDTLLKNLGHPQDPELVKRVEERADAIRDRIFRENGFLNVAVDLIRETRDE
jgi:hypothetical protein